MEKQFSVEKYPGRIASLRSKWGFDSQKILSSTCEHGKAVSNTMMMHMYTHLHPSYKHIHAHSHICIYIKLVCEYMYTAYIKQVISPLSPSVHHYYPITVIHLHSPTDHFPLLYPSPFPFTLLFSLYFSLHVLTAFYLQSLLFCSHSLLFTSSSWDATWTLTWYSLSLWRHH